MPLVKGDIHAIRSRNLAVGVYTGKKEMTNGVMQPTFIGIRRKFGAAYLTTEAAWWVSAARIGYTHLELSERNEALKDALYRMERRAREKNPWP